MAIAARFNVEIPDQSIPSDAIRGPIADTKLDHQIPVVYSQNIAGIVVAETLSLYTAPAAGNIKSVTVKIGVDPASGSYTVDVQKAASGSNSYSTILSAVASITTSSGDGSETKPTLSTTTYAADDTFQVIVLVSTPTGSLGVTCTILLDQDP